jgi:hypothetical protein
MIIIAITWIKEDIKMVDQINEILGKYRIKHNGVKVRPCMLVTKIEFLVYKNVAVFDLLKAEKDIFDWLMGGHVFTYVETSEKNYLIVKMNIYHNEKGINDA